MKELRKHGLSFVESAIEKDDEAFTISKELIECLFCDISKLSTKYCNEIFCDLPYTYSERRIDCVLLPALSKLSHSMVLVELPAHRHCSNRKFKVNDSNGRIDYWCIYKGYSFVIELKHSFDCFTTQKTRDDKVVNRWLKMNEQLESVKDEVRLYEEQTKGVIRIGVHIITSYSDKAPDKDLVSQFRDSIPDTMERLTKDLGKRYPSLKPDVIICWKIPNKIIFSVEQTFPGLWAVAKIYPPIQHRGATK